MAGLQNEQNIHTNYAQHRTKEKKPSVLQSNDGDNILSPVIDTDENQRDGADLLGKHMHASDVNFLKIKYLLCLLSTAVHTNSYIRCSRLEIEERSDIIY